MNSILFPLAFTHFAISQAGAQENSERHSNTNPIVRTVQLREGENTRFRELVLALLEQSRVYWGQKLLSDFGSLTDQEKARLQGLKDEANEMKLAYESGFDRILESIEKDKDAFASPSSTRSLKVFAAALQAFRAMHPNQQDSLRRAVNLLEPLSQLMLDSRISEEHAVFSLSVLSTAYLQLDMEREAIKLLGAFFEKRKEHVSMPKTLLLTLYGDALFRSFRYRESFENYSQAAQNEAIDLRLAKHLRLRLLWAAYRSGFYEEAITALESICSEDSEFWKSSERDFFNEIARIGATVFYRLGKLDRVKSFSAQARFGECRAKVSLGYVEKHARNGQFLLSLTAYDMLLPEMVYSPEFLDAARIAKEAAERDRQGIDKNKSREIVRFAVPIISKGGEWERVYATHSHAAIQKKRENFVKEFSLAAADSYYEEALLEARPDSFVTAALLFSARLQEADVFLEKPSVTFKLGYSLFRSGQLEKARKEIDDALKMNGLKPDYRMAGRETLSAIAAMKYQQNPSEANLMAWLVEVTELMSEFPSIRSLQLAMNYFEVAEQQAHGRVLQQLHELVLMLAPTPQKFSEIKADCIDMLIRLVISEEDKKLALLKFAQFERMFRGSLAVKEFAKIEQANHTLMMTYYSKLRSEGRLNDSLETLELWTKTNLENSFLPEALAELVERRYERNQWEAVLGVSNEFIKIQEKGTRLEPGAILASSPAALRIKYLRALAFESLYQFPGAVKNFLELGTMEGSPGAASRRALIERYLNWLEPTQRRQILELAAREEPSNARTLLFGLREALNENDERGLAIWIERSEKVATGASTAQQRLVQGIARLAKGARARTPGSAATSLRGDAVKEIISKESFFESAVDLQSAARAVVSQLLLNEMRRSVSLQDYLNVAMRASAVPTGALSVGFGNELCESVDRLKSVSGAGLGGTGAKAKSSGVDGFFNSKRLHELSTSLALAILKHRKSSEYCSRCEAVNGRGPQSVSAARTEFEFLRLVRNLVNTLGYKVKPEEFSELLGVDTPFFEQTIGLELSKAVFKDTVYELEE